MNEEKTQQVLDGSFWEERYIKNDTGWDLKEVSPPLKAYFDQLTNKNIRILIPGCGNAYESEYLLQKGFNNITLIDISPTLTQSLKEKLAGTPIKVVLGDFFEHEGEYDLIIEQTFFCALEPTLREQYVQKMHSLLAQNGKIAGVLFNREFEGGPPFGGAENEYRQLFSTYFNIKQLSPCYNSFSKRQGTEVFVVFEKK